MSQLVLCGSRDGVRRWRVKGRENTPTHAPCVDGFVPDPAHTPTPACVSVTGEMRDGSLLIRVRGVRGADLYGCGEHAGGLRRNGKQVVCWNTDAYRYDDSSPSLYQSHPWVMGVTNDGRWFGVLADTPARVTIDLTRVDDDEFTSVCECDPPDVYLIEGDEPGDVVRLLSELTGKMRMPPRWALGYHQCRYSYKSAARVLGVAREFRARDIPCSAVWVDIDYMDGYRCFTFDRERFPNPRALNDELHAMRMRSVWMIDPGIKVDPDYLVYQEGRARGAFVTAPDGEEFRGKVWPGECAFPDFLSADVRAWWAGLYADFLSHGMDGVWNDMNEPSVFETPTKTMDESALHRADDNLGGPGSHAQYHNAYGHFMLRATYEGVITQRPGVRPFVLTRSGRPGSQRYAATWTGDNTSNWDHLAWSIPMTLNLGLSGQPFVGPDIGGYTGNADARIFMRWMGIGAFLPFARGHTEKGTRAHEPWSFGPTCEAVCRAALKARERLMPYLYTCFYEAAQTGLPVVRPLFFADPRDARLRDVSDAFLLGSDLMVRTRSTPDGECRAPRLPAWHAIDLYGEIDAAWRRELPELLISEGAAVPIAGKGEEVDVVACPDASGASVGDLYADDGETPVGSGHTFALGRIEVRDGQARFGRVRGVPALLPRLGRVAIAGSPR